MALNLLSAGAAKGLIDDLRQRFQQQTGHEIQGSFGAIGAMKERFEAGEACDVIILSAAMIDQLQAVGGLLAGSARALGKVRTGVAVPAGAPLPAVDSAMALASSLEAASAIYFPDPVKATAGIHFMKVLTTLGLADRVGDRLRPFPNGATAMAAMARDGTAGALGVTQVSEILYTPGVSLVAPLPTAFELVTVYSIGITARAANPALASRLVALACADDRAADRRRAGFED